MKRIIAIGGGELKSKTTKYIDAYVAKIAKEHANGNRAYGLFLGTASHDSMPYFNSFRKTYTSDFDIKADCALTVYGEMNYDKIEGKFKKADFIYIGGGDTLYMMQQFKNSGLDKLILDAYEREVPIVGLSAGAIFWFVDMYTDSVSTYNNDKYSFEKGIGLINGLCCPHYNQRVADFNEAFLSSNFNTCFAIEDDCAIEFRNGMIYGSVSEDKNAYVLRKNNGLIEKFTVSKIK